MRGLGMGLVMGLRMGFTFQSQSIWCRASRQRRNGPMMTCTWDRHGRNATESIREAAECGLDAVWQEKIADMSERSGKANRTHVEECETRWRRRMATKAWQEAIQPKFGSGSGGSNRIYVNVTGKTLQFVDTGRLRRHRTTGFAQCHRGQSFLGRTSLAVVRCTCLPRDFPRWLRSG